SRSYFRAYALYRLVPFFPTRRSSDLEAGDALVVATSGTTGEPKGVVLTMAAVEASARATSARLGVDPTRHRWLACLPLAHVGGLDRKSTRLNSSHVKNSYAVFCLKKK